jgi:hypothetical protein
MLLNTHRLQHYLQTSDLSTLFVEELGWDRHVATLSITIDRQPYTLRVVARKRGMVAYTCAPGEDGCIPPGPIRRAIEQQVALAVREHLIIFHDTARAESIWQWVRRELGQPTVPREEYYHREQPGHRLIQRLQAIAFTLEEEPDLTHTDVLHRVRAAFDVERITRRFYDGFKVEHETFTRTLRGIPDIANQRWYTSVLLNRLMFTYFIQKKGLLDGDTDYLRTHFAQSQRRGRDRYYRDFLQPLFFAGLAQPRERRAPEVIRLLDEVPYLNGGLFYVHGIERQYGNSIAIADEAFERPLEFFDDYDWHLDDRPLRDEGEINPEVLGYIFEKYINQKQMGAYYTKEDITGYIARSTIVPALFDSAQAQHPPAFVVTGPFWNTLRSDPDRYIPRDLQYGAENELPTSVATGINDVAQRAAWNSAALATYALPTEIWREVVGRREHYQALRTRLASGEVHTVNDLITGNIDLDAVARNIIATIDDPELLLAFWRSIEQITILDPTCGSGAFLFAALNVLQPLYELCLDRMAVLVREEQSISIPRLRTTLDTFHTVLERAAQHPNREYFVLKSIIVNNLYGVG